MAYTNNVIPSINTIFDDLDQYLSFCQQFGYKFDERDLYNVRSFSFKQFQRFQNGKPAKNQWEVDLEKYKEQELLKGI